MKRRPDDGEFLRNIDAGFLRMRIRTPSCPKNPISIPRMRFIPLILCCLSGHAWATDLPKLTISPDLLGGTPSQREAAAPDAPTTASAPAVETNAPTQPETQVVKTPAKSSPSTQAKIRTEVSPAPTPATVEAPKAATAPVPVAATSAPATLITPATTSKAAVQADPAPVKPESPSQNIENPALPKQTYIQSDEVHGVRGQISVAEGNAELRRDDVLLIADTLRYQELTDIVNAQGHVWVFKDNTLITGPEAQLQVSEKVGSFDRPHYTISRDAKTPGENTQRTITASGQADELFFEGENQYVLKNATWSTCSPPRPDWYLRAPDMALDFDREKGVTENATLIFKDVPIFYTPWLEFPLAGQRQSGFLTPTFGSSNKTGIDFSTPYYWNIAPNYDATLTPRWMGRRGLELRGEYRYITENYAGQDKLEWVPNDAVRGGARGAASIQHSQNLFPGLVGSVNWNGVSDDTYLKDFGNKVTTSSTINLVREARLNYLAGGWWDAGALLQSYQTLEGASPYRRLPQLTFKAARPDLPWGTSASINSEFVAFAHPDSAMPTGQRAVIYPQLSLPYETPGYFVTPKIGVNAAQYSLNQDSTSGTRNLSRSIPITSLDSGLIFERETDTFGRNFIQTLEPRLYYLYVPYRDQSNTPNFDSALFDMNFAQFFSENIYSGGDRVANANQVTLAVSSRLIEPNTGEERVRTAFGQRYYFDDLKVPLAGFATRNNKNPDTLAALSAKLTQTLKVDTALQYDTADRDVERFNASLRYQPSLAHAFSTSYRYTRDAVRDIDFAGQWPLGGGWYGVGRYTRSLRDHRVTEALAGLEFNAGCWVFRTAFHRFTTSTSDVTQAIFFQLELGGLASIGTSPVNLLKRSIYGYGNINGSAADPIFGEP